VILSGNVCTTCVFTHSLPLPYAGTFLTDHYQTEAHLQRPWGNFEFSGRVRISDGLVVLVRQLVGHCRAVCYCQQKILNCALSVGQRARG
jgi:hypothetical protein